jgi:3'-5' exonuclease
MFDNHQNDDQPRAYVVLDIESAVLDESGHRRYQQMERWCPSRDSDKSRRGYKRGEDPLKTPRWVFQTITTAAAMVLVEHQDGNLEVARFVTLSAPEHDERAVVAGLLDVLTDAPAGAAIASWAGSFHDISLIVMAAMKHGLTLPGGWRWLAFGGQHRTRHVDFARNVTGGLKMKPIHLAEVAAALDIPAKLTVPPFAVAGLIEAGAWGAVASAVEVDCISTALLLARWRRLFDDRAEVRVVEDRILRQVEELRPNRLYIPALRAHRAAGLNAVAANDRAPIPWVTGYAA